MNLFCERYMLRVYGNVADPKILSDLCCHSM